MFFSFLLYRKNHGNHGFSSESLDPRSCFWTCAFMPNKRWYPQALNSSRSYVYINIMRLFFFSFFSLCSALTMILRVGFIRTVSKPIELESPGGSGLEENLKSFKTWVTGSLQLDSVFETVMYTYWHHYWMFFVAIVNTRNKCAYGDGYPCKLGWSYGCESGKITFIKW